MIKRKKLLEKVYQEEISLEIIREYVTWHDMQDDVQKIALIKPQVQAADPLANPNSKSSSKTKSDGFSKVGGGSNKRKRPTPSPKK